MRKKLHRKCLADEIAKGKNTRAYIDEYVGPVAGGVIDEAINEGQRFLLPPVHEQSSIASLNGKTVETRPEWFRLPYPRMTIEFDAPPESMDDPEHNPDPPGFIGFKPSRFFAAIAEIEDYGVLIWPFYRPPPGLGLPTQEWRPSPYGIHFKQVGSIFGPVPCHQKNLTVDSKWDEKFDISWKYNTRFEANALVDFLLMLTCANVKVAKRKWTNPNAKKNKKHYRPISRYNVVELPPVRYVDAEPGEASTPAAARRAHYRRGFIRHLAHKNVWVSATFVRGSGFADKIYRS